MKLTLASTMELNNGVKIPVLGLGTLHATGDALHHAILWALDAGYRHLDTAKAYGNEREVGRAIKRCGLPREEIFLTTKLWNEDHGYANTLAAFDRSLKALDVDFVDLYLVHWPVAGRRVETWKAMERILAEGKARTIGVSNFTIRHLEELMAATDIVPAVNQIEFTPYLYQRELQAYCAEKGIVIEAWSPLTRAIKLQDPPLVAIAARYRRSPAQILLRWGLQQNAVVIPKSVHKERILENAQIFDFHLAEADMERLNGLHEGLRTSGWDPESDRFK